jgi:hypothetical protein
VGNEGKWAVRRVGLVTKTDVAEEPHTKIDVVPTNQLPVITT